MRLSRSCVRRCRTRDGTPTCSRGWADSRRSWSGRGSERTRRRRRLCIRCGRRRRAVGCTVGRACSGPVEGSLPAISSSASPWSSTSWSADVEVHPDDRPYAWAEVDVGAIEHNAKTLSELAAPAALCAVVKGWGYGHGILRAATAAVRGRASWLGVALVSEAIDVRVAGGLTEPVLVLAEPPLRQLVEVAQLDGVRPTLYTAEAIEAAAAAVRTCGRRQPLPVHLKVDTGMHRVGASPEAARHLAEMIVAAEELELEGVWTHLAAAEDPAHNDYTARQLATFEDLRRTLAEARIVPPMVHA